MQRYFDEAQLQSLLFVPVGAGAKCLGYFVVCREPGTSGWTAQELEAALDIGHDIGHALLNARLFQREQLLVGELRQLDRFRRQLISTISHELRTPLTSVVGYAELLETESNLSDDGHRAVAAINTNAVRLSQIIEDLLLLSGIRSAETVDDRRLVDLGAAVEDALDLLSLQILSKGLDLEYSAPDEPVVVNGHPVEIARVCANLISNAAKYTPAGGRVRVAVTASDFRAVLSVSDTGIGIAEEEQDSVFDEFVRSADPQVADSEGTGLGLAIVKRIVTTHKGTIELDSTLGQGSTFTVSLPLAQ